LYGFCTLGGCDRGMPIPPNYDLANEFKIAEFLTFAGSVLDYEITEELADTPLQLKLTKANGDFLLYYFNTLSVSPLEASKVITIYPNPVRYNISISSKVKINNTTFTILDISGKLIKSYNGLNENSIDVSTLEKGIYFMKITTDETTAITKKFIKI